MSSSKHWERYVPVRPQLVSDVARFFVGGFKEIKGKKGTGRKMLVNSPQERNGDHPSMDVGGS